MNYANSLGALNNPQNLNSPPKTAKDFNKTCPEHLHFIPDFEKCLQNFSSLNTMKVTNLAPLTTHYGQNGLMFTKLWYF